MIVNNLDEENINGNVWTFKTIRNKLKNTRQVFETYTNGHSKMMNQILALNKKATAYEEIL